MSTRRQGPHPLGGHPGGPPYRPAGGGDDREPEPGPGTETGDREGFLGRLEARLAGGVPENPVHRPPPRLDAVPPIVNTTVDPADLLGTFERACAKATTVVHRVSAGDDLRAAVRAVVESERITRAVVSAEEAVDPVATELRALAVTVDPYGREAGAATDLGVTACVGAIAATGSVVLDSAVAGGRGASLLPRVHLCVVDRDQIVPTLSEIVRPLTGHPETLPSNLVIVSGPSRTGDIEQLITLGVHGPTRVHILVRERS